MVLLDKYCAGNRKPNSALLWEYDASNFDWQKSKVIVVQRVVEMGEPEDFFAAFDLYGGIDGFKAIVRTVPYLNNLDMHFVCTLFNLKKDELRCYTRKQSNQELWIY